MPGEGTDVGRIVGYLTLDRSDWRAGIEAAKAEARSLARESPTVRIDVDSAAAIGKIKAVDAAARTAGGKSGGMGLLLTSILAIGPALVPLAAVATGALIGLGAAGGVAVLGILGIRDAMKQGTAEGQRYRQAFAPVVTEFSHLKQLSAAGMFDGINAGVKSSRSLFPQLNRDVALYSSQIGQIVGHTGPGLVALLGQMDPLFRTIGGDLVTGSARFQHWATSSDAVRNFVADVQNELPRAEATIGSLIETGSHILQGFAPWGGTVLTSVRLLSTAFNSIPIGVLQTFIPLLVSGALAFKAWNAADAASTKLSGFSTKLAASGGIASKASGFMGAASTAVRGLGIAGTVAAVGLGVMSAVMGRHSQAAVQETKRINELVQAIQNGTAEIGAWNNAMETGAAAGTKTGLSQHEIVAAITETAVQYQDAQQHLADYQKTQDSAAVTGGQFGATAQQVATRQQEVAAETNKLQSSLASSRAEYEAAKAKVGEYATQQGDATLAAQIASGAYRQIAASLGLSGDAYVQAKLAADKNTQTIKDQTAAMVLENNAIGLLNQALQGLGGNNLGVASATTAMRTATAAAGAAFRTNGRTIDENTAKGRANEGALQQQAQSAIALAQAVEQNTGSTKKGNAALADSKRRLEAALSSQHALTPAIQAYIDTLYKIPPRKTTKVDADTAAARAKIAAVTAWIASLNPILTVSIHTKGAPNAGGAGHQAQAATGGTVTRNGIKRYDFGGTVGGRGGPTADDQLIWASTDEEIIPAAAARKHRPLLKAIAADRYAGGGTVGAGSSGPRRRSGGRLHGRLEISADSQGTLRAWVRDIVLDEGDFAGTTGRM